MLHKSYLPLADAPGPISVVLDDPLDDTRQLKHCNNFPKKNTTAMI
jgi:hypothetical protein